MTTPVRLRLDRALEGEIQPRDLRDLKQMRAEAVARIWNHPGTDPAAALRRVDGAVQTLVKQLKENA